MATNYDNIYVDLTRTLADDISAKYKVDEDGVVECDDDTKTGIRNYPLSYAQWTKYMARDHGIDDTTYHIFGLYIELIDLTPTITTPRGVNNTIRLQLWNKNNVDVPAPYTLSYGFGEIIETLYFEINTNKVYISDMQLQMNPGHISFGSINSIVDGKNKNSGVGITKITTNTDQSELQSELTITNSKIWMDTYVAYGGNSDAERLIFSRIKKVTLINTLVHSDNPSTYVPHLLFDARGIHNTSVDIHGCLFSGLEGIFWKASDNGIPWSPALTSSLYIEPTLRISHCAFGKPYNDVVTGSTPEEVNSKRLFTNDFDTNTISYNWCDSSDLPVNLETANFSADFDYSENDGSTGPWTKLRTLTDTNEWSSLLTDGTYYGLQRDGIGPLYFPTMETSGLYVTADPKYGTSGTSVTATVSGDISPTGYTPGYYDYTMDGTATSTSTSSMQFTMTDYGPVNIGATAYSIHGWYSDNLIPTKFQSYIDVNDITLSGDFYAEDDTEYTTPITESTLFENIILYVENNSTDGIEINSWSVDWDDGNGYVTGTGQPMKSTNMYTISGTYNVSLKTTLNDGKIINDSYPLSISNNVQDTYYVDLSLVNEDSWLELKTGIIDTFESGSFDYRWFSSVSANCEILTMYDEKVAVLSAGSSGTIFCLDDPIGGELSATFSFVRTSRTEIPSFVLRPSEKTLELVKVEWDYVNDEIIFTTGYEVHTHKYNVDDFGYVRDLRCPNSLRKLEVRITTDNTIDGKWLFSVKFVDDWIPIKTMNSDGYEFINPVFVPTQNVGYGYMNIQSDYGCPIVNGSVDMPLTYEDMKARIKTDGTGNYNDKYLCKNYRVLQETIVVDSTKFFEISAWDLSLYGPWMLVFGFRYTSPNSPVISFVGSKLSNGIMYNVHSSRQFRFVPYIEFSFLYDMFITWQGRQGKIGLISSPWKNRALEYTDVTGSTIKSENGFYTE